VFYIVLLLFLLIGSALTVITVQNLDTPVHVALFSWQTPELPIGVMLIIAFLAGALLLYLISLLSAWKERRELRRLRRRVRELEQRDALKLPPGAIAPPAGALSPSAPLMGMPGIAATPQSGQDATLPMPDFRQQSQ